MSSTIKMIALLRELKKEMNGAVTGGMQQRGLNYALNYGVSIPTIRDIAEKYAPDAELAKLLIRQDVRELKIAAVYVANPQKIDRSEFLLWKDNLKTVELLDHATLFLFAELPFWNEIVKEWFDSSDPFYIHGALNISGKILKSEQIGMDKMSEILEKAVSAIEKNPDVPSRPCIYFFTSFAGTSPVNSGKLKSVLEKWKLSDNLVDLANEVSAFID